MCSRHIAHYGFHRVYAADVCCASHDILYLIMNFVRRRENQAIVSWKTLPYAVTLQWKMWMAKYFSVWYVAGGYRVRFERMDTGLRVRLGGMEEIQWQSWKLFMRKSFGLKHKKDCEQAQGGSFPEILTPRVSSVEKGLFREWFLRSETGFKFLSFFECLNEQQIPLRAVFTPVKIICRSFAPCMCQGGFEACCPAQGEICRTSFLQRMASSVKLRSLIACWRCGCTLRRCIKDKFRASLLEESVTE